MSDTVFIYPKNPNVFEIVKSNLNRYVPLDRIKKVKGSCKWCMEKVEGLKHYCSENCKSSAWAFFYPQKYSHRFLMKRQNDCCNGCGYNFRDETKKFTRTEKCRTYNFELKKYEITGTFTTTYTDWGDVDHIIPIHQGGEILGIENLQLLCRECHQIKTSKENSGSRKGRVK